MTKTTNMKTVSIILTLLLASCVSMQKRMDALIGQSKQDVYMQLGVPTRMSDDAIGGEIIIFDKLKSGFGYGAQQYYEHTFVYVNASGIVYYWMMENSPSPATQLDINLYIRTPSRTKVATGY